MVESYNEGAVPRSYLTSNYSLNLSANLSPEQEAALDDHRLLSGLQAGDEAAYEQLIQRFQGPIFNLACRLLNDPADASDVLQEVFLKIFRNVDSFRGRQQSEDLGLPDCGERSLHNRRRWLFRHRRGETAIDETYEESTCGSGRSGSG